MVRSLVVYEDDLVTCFLSKEPISEGHTLVVPKKPYLDSDELDTQTAEHIMRASMLVSKALKSIYHPDGISIMQNGGAFNDVGHYHMHVFCRFTGDGFGWTFRKYNQTQFYTTAVQQKLKEAIVTKR
jgi:diadenosine tetraphosphate (Ap4A) HIT family hydrolase